MIRPRKKLTWYVGPGVREFLVFNRVLLCILPLCPSQFANEPSLDFDDISDKSPAQEFEVAVGREVGEYAVRHVFVHRAFELDNNHRSLRATKFTNVASVTLFIPSNQGAESTRLYYIGFLGHWTQVRKIPLLSCILGLSCYT